MNNDDADKILFDSFVDRVPDRIARRPQANIVRITPKAKNAIETAVAYSIAQGDKVDIEQEKITEVKPSAEITLSHKGISMSGGVAITRITKNKFKMKD